MFTFWPCHQNGIKSTSRNLTFWHTWAPKPPQVRKMRARENTPKNTSAKIPKKCQNDLQNGLHFRGKNAFFSLPDSRPTPKGTPGPKIHNFHRFFVFLRVLFYVFLFFGEQHQQKKTQKAEEPCKGLALLQAFIRRFLGGRCWHAVGVFDYSSTPHSYRLMPCCIVIATISKVPLLPTIIRF